MRIPPPPRCCPPLYICIVGCVCALLTGYKIHTLSYTHQILIPARQGEADVGQPDYYECAFPTMIRAWRRLLRHSSQPTSVDPTTGGHSGIASEEGRGGGGWWHSQPMDAPEAEGGGVMPFGFVQLAS